MLDVHLDEFFKDCASILLMGLKHFPKPQTLFVQDISGIDDMDEFGLHSDRHLSALGAITWLKEEGFIRFSGYDRQESVDDFVLTARSLRQLLKPASNPNQQDPTPMFQTLEFALLDGDTSWVKQLLQDQVFSD
ncbi:hypothetical protein [Oceanobacter kriegii]|uniref:hypothetical protein n=1 Tax=Oceanobacter kriegii TaxID=64972 RepID=UPI000417B336|nr:hypothetical protein [Oceanobacter kriegii]